MPSVGPFRTRDARAAVALTSTAFGSSTSSAHRRATSGGLPNSSCRLRRRRRRSDGSRSTTRPRRGGRAPGPTGRRRGGGSCPPSRRPARRAPRRRRRRWADRGRVRTRGRRRCARARRAGGGAGRRTRCRRTCPVPLAVEAAESVQRDISEVEAIHRHDGGRHGSRVQCVANGFGGGGLARAGSARDPHQEPRAGLRAGGKLRSEPDKQVRRLGHGCSPRIARATSGANSCRSTRSYRQAWPASATRTMLALGRADAR